MTFIKISTRISANFQVLSSLSPWCAGNLSCCSGFLPTELLVDVFQFHCVSPWAQGWYCWHYVTICVFSQDIPLPLQMFSLFTIPQSMKAFSCDIYRVLGLCKLLMSVAVWKSVIVEPQQCSHCSPLLTAVPAFLFEIVLIIYDSNLQHSVTH